MQCIGYIPGFKTAGRGVALMEMLAALALVALALTLAGPAAQTVSSVWRLRAAAQKIRNLVQFARNEAAARGRPMRVLYDPEAGMAWGMDGGATFATQNLPRGVKLRSVGFPDGTTVLRDVASVMAFPDGTLDPHRVEVEAEGRTARLSFARLTGAASYQEFSGH